MGFGVVDILLIEFLFGDEGISIEDAQLIEEKAEELCQLSQCKVRSCSPPQHRQLGGCRLDFGATVSMLRQCRLRLLAPQDSRRSRPHFLMSTILGHA